MTKELPIAGNERLREVQSRTITFGEAKYHAKIQLIRPGAGCAFRCGYQGQRNLRYIIILCALQNSIVKRRTNNDRVFLVFQHPDRIGGRDEKSMTETGNKDLLVR